MTGPIVGLQSLPPPWTPTPVEPAVLSAIKALYQHRADEAQQARVVDWLASACGVADLEFRPGDERASAFAAGKRFIALQFFSLAQSSEPTKESP